MIRLAAVGLLVFAGTAHAAGPTLRVREVPPDAPVSSAPGRFDLVGLHWRGPGTVSFRTRDLHGRWSAWRAAAPEPEDRPDSVSLETRGSRGWTIGNPYWTGGADRIQYRTRGRVTRLRAYFVRSRGSRSRPAVRRLTAAGAPQIVGRAAWGAPPPARAPGYAEAVRFAVVHHTAGSNAYGPGQSAAIVRAVTRYHMGANGWHDVGYNFLVDKYGQIFEGRSGGITRNVVGDHAQGFNVGTVGVALLGNYNSSTVSPAARSALARLLAWRLDVAHVDPLSSVAAASSGNPRFPFGTTVRLRAVSGHRDTGPTSCPGDRLYTELGALARTVAVTGLPKIYSPAVRGSVGAAVRFTARLSNALVWTVTVKNAARETVALGMGVGTAVDWTWDARSAPPGRYTYAIAAGGPGFGARPATGVLGRAAPPLAVTGLAVTPRLISPNGDARGETAVIRYRLSAPATVSITLADGAGVTLSSLFTGFRRAGQQSAPLGAVTVPDGRYRVVLTARAAGRKEVAASVPIVVDRTLAAFAATPAAISPNGDGRVDTTTFTFRLAAPAFVRLTLRQRGVERAAVLAEDRLAGPQSVVWDGAAGSARVPDGRYTAIVSATGPIATATQSAAVVVDTRAPRLRLLSFRRLDFWVSEPATVTLHVNGRRIVKVERAGRFHVPFAGRVRSVRAVAVDAAGNASRSLRSP